MAEKDVNVDAGEEISVVVIEDEEGNEFYYEEDMVIPYDNKEFAILISLPPEDCEDGCACHEETEVIIARIDKDENGDPLYVAPEDDEFDAVQKIYEEIDEDEEN